MAWFHVASLGEYEQAKPVIEALKASQNDLKIVVSFFSPSGFNQLYKKPGPLIDFITYLPLDSKRQAQKFVGVLNPSVVFFVKYDLWYHHIEAVKNLGAPIYLISASFRPDQIYFSRIRFFQKILKSFNLIFTQNQQSIDLLKSIGCETGILAGDTRFDRVIATAKDPKKFPELAKWTNGNQILVAGSVWQEDMQILIPQINSSTNTKWLIAPHSLYLKSMNSWMSLISKKSTLYSLWDKIAMDPQVIFIDNIGMLSSLYQFASLAYVGGAFGKGLHNILEPIGFMTPVIFGSLRRIEKFPEAEQCKQEGCGFEVADSAELTSVIELLEDPSAFNKAKQSARKWIKANQGASDLIIKEILRREQS
jgi:3-deoxy-D-manno-octulosonic-acid transferase